MDNGASADERKRRERVGRPEDFLDIDALLTDEERAGRDRVRSFVEARIAPEVEGWFEHGHFPRELIREFGTLGVLGMHLEGYGCPGRSAVEYGLACLELEAGDSGLRTIVSVQGSLAMTSIRHWGSEDQRNEWLPRMAAGEAIGCFGLTEAEGGSDPASMQTQARRDGGDWVMNGSKRWIGLASIADVAVVWARTDDGVRGFLVPADTRGFTTTDITNKLGMRASLQCELLFEDCRLPAAAMLPEARGLRGPFTALNEARYGITWGAMGAARACFEAALEYAKERVVFGQPIAGHQLTQRKLVDMLVELNKGMLLALHLGRMKDEGRLRPVQISVGKLNNVREAIAIAREARTILGGNGITSDFPVMRHMNNLEAVSTYEGTDEMHALILGEAITGLPAFRQAAPIEPVAPVAVAGG